MTNLENLKEIPGYENYLISKEGKIYSKKSRKFLAQNVERWKKLETSIKIGLRSNGKETKCLAHRLVALTYIPNPENKKYVQHKDRDYYNNSVENLKWSTQEDRVDHFINNLKKNRQISCAIVKISKDGLATHYDSITDASKSGQGINQSNISRWLSGDRNSSDGSKWVYKSDYDMGGEVLKKEVWKPVIIGGEKTKYFISNLGRLRNNNSLRKGSILVGYVRYYITLNGKTSQIPAHRLVADAFLAPPALPGMTVDHKDRDKLNNRVENLRWATGSEQALNMDRSNSGKNSKGVIMSNKSGEELKRFRSVDEAYEFITGYKGRGGVIAKSCRKEREFAHGYRWSYIEDHYETKRKKITNFNQPIVNITENGLVIKYENLKEACEYEDVNPRIIRAWIRKEKNSPDGEWMLEIDFNSLN